MIVLKILRRWKNITYLECDKNKLMKTIIESLLHVGVEKIVV